MTLPVLSASGLAVRRGRRLLLEGIDLAVPARGAVLVTGPNGCGKTSLLRVLCGLAPPARGSVARRGGAAYVPERVALTPSLRALEWLTRVRDLRGLPPTDWAAAARAAGLDPGALASPVGTLSNGTRRRIVTLEALAARPALLVLDEPFAGLDEDASAWLLGELTAARAAGGAVVLTDHTRGAEEVADVEHLAFRDTRLVPA